LELAGGFAGEVEGAVEVAGAELAKGEFKEHAGFAEAGGGFEEDRGVALEGGGQFGGGGLLAGARCGERWPVCEMPKAFAGAETEVEKLGDALEFDAKEVFIGGAEREGLSQEELNALDDVVEIPIYGQPYSYNVATATTMAVYEYCKQYPSG
jgi:hypothetical protein